MSQPTLVYSRLAADDCDGSEVAQNQLNEPRRRRLVYTAPRSESSDGSPLAGIEIHDCLDMANLTISNQDDGAHRASGSGQSHAQKGAVQNQIEVEEAFPVNPHKPTSRNSSRAWWLEITSIVLSTCSLVSVAIVLLAYQNKPLSSWRLKYLPNSVISQLMTITRSTLMLSTASCISQSCWLYMHRKPRSLFGIQLFDGASRGPAGAAILLASPARFSILAVLGALITITTLLMESFTQQVIQYPLKNVIGESSGSFPVTQIYAPVPLAVDGASRALNNEANVNSSIQAAIVDSFFGVSLADMYNCPTNSCSWQTNAATIGLCSSCTNVTSATNKNCSNFIPPLGETMCNYTTPRGLQLQTRYWAGEAQAGYQTRISTDARAEGNQSLVTFASLTMTDTITTGFLTYTGVTECTIDWCARVYRNASVTGRQFLASVDEYPLLYSGSWVNSSILGPVQPEFITLQAEPGFPAKLNSTFTVQRTNANSLADFLVRALRSGNLTQVSGGATVPGEAPSFSFGAAMIDQPSIPFIADKLAMSLTNAIRGLTTMNTQQAVGQSSVTIQYIHVRWLWLILPSIIVLFGIMLLAATIYQSCRSGVAIWKSSPLALLFHPLQGWSHADLEHVAVPGMEKSAKAMPAQLIKDADSHWRFARAQEPSQPAD